MGALSSFEEGDWRGDSLVPHSPLTIPSPVSGSWKATVETSLTHFSACSLVQIWRSEDPERSSRAFPAVRYRGKPEASFSKGRNYENKIKEARTVPIPVWNGTGSNSPRVQSSWIQNWPFQPMTKRWSAREKIKQVRLLSPRMAKLADAPDLKSGGW